MFWWNDFSQAGFDDWDHLRQLAIIGFCFWLARDNVTFIAAASSQLIYANALCKDSLHDLNPSDWYSIFIHSQHTFNFHFVVKNPLITQYAFISFCAAIKYLKKERKKLMAYWHILATIKKSNYKANLIFCMDFFR